MIRKRRTTRQVAVALIAGVLVFSLAVVTAGCTSGDSGGQDAGAPSSGGAAAVAPEQRAPGANQAAGDASKLAPLPPERRSELASGFPIEIPVPDGAITRTDAQGDSAWVYEMSVNAQPFDVAAWYRAAYASANWQLVRDEVAESGGMLIFVKGAGAQSKLQLTTEPGGTNITASVGVGEAVGETL